jgi:hypothetical protein
MSHISILHPSGGVHGRAASNPGGGGSRHVTCRMRSSLRTTSVRISGLGFHDMDSRDSVTSHPSPVGCGVWIVLERLVMHHRTWIVGVQWGGDGEGHRRQKIHLCTTHFTHSPPLNVLRPQRTRHSQGDHHRRVVLSIRASNPIGRLALAEGR